MKSSIKYFVRKKDQNRFEVSDLSGKAFQFFRIAEKLFDLHFPGKNPKSVHCFWNNTAVNEGSLKMDVHFRFKAYESSTEFVVEVMLWASEDRTVRVRWSEIPVGLCGYHSCDPVYGRAAGETDIYLN